MTENILIIVACALIAVLVPMAFYAFLKKRYRITSQPFWAGVIAFVVFALILERLALAVLYGTDFWARLLATPLKAVALAGLVAGVFEETGCLISMKISALLQDREEREEEEKLNSVSAKVKSQVMVVEHERNHALLHGLGHGTAVVVIFVVTMILNLIYSFRGSSVFMATADPIDSFASEAFVRAVTSMQGFRAVDFIYSLIEELAALGIHISLAVMVWISMKGSWFRLFFPLSIFLHAFSDVLVEVLVESGISPFMCVVFFVTVSLTIVQFTIIVWNRIKMGTVLKAVQNVSEQAE